MRSIILYNAGERELKRYDYIIELCRYKTKCFKCTAIIQRVRSLLDNITSIRKYQILGICEHCKRTNIRKKCARCEHIVSQFIKNKVQNFKDHEEMVTAWFSKVQQLLMSIIQGQLFCKHNVWYDYDLKIQFDTLLQHLKSSLSVEQPYLEIYTDGICLQNTDIKINKIKQILDEYLSKLKIINNTGIDIEKSFSNSLSDSESTCVCKYLKKDEIKSTLTPLFETLSVTDITQKLSKNSSEIYKINNVKRNSSSLPFIKVKEMNRDKKDEFFKNQDNDSTGDHINITKQRENKEVAKKQENYLTGGHNNVIKQRENKEVVKKQKKCMVEGQIDNKKNLTVKQHAQTTSIHKQKEKDKNRDSVLILQLIKERDLKKQYKKSHKIQEEAMKFPAIINLPIFETEVRTNVDTTDQASTMECSETSEQEITEKIKGNKIIPLSSFRCKGDKIKTPLLFQVLADTTTPEIESQQLLSEDKTIPEIQNALDNTGVMFYKLSNREFIEKGWTKLPTTKIMRRMNVYKMISCNDESDWFRSHLKQKILFYDSGEKLAEIYENGCGKWFYENGNIALDYYNATSKNAGRRYVIYSSVEDNFVVNKKKTNTVLGCFDSLGNGVVYDHCGNVRIKYNQSEGLVIDKKIGPPGRWIWHTLNEPPIIQNVFFDTIVDVDPCIQKLVKEKTVIKEPNEEMIVIELKNFVKARATQMLKTYKPFEIRMKALKMNDYFSLKIIDQSKIYIIFSCKHKYFKQNIGMIVKSDEIIDTEVSDFANVPTPYDSKLPKSDSLTDIQNILMKAKRVEH